MKKIFLILFLIGILPYPANGNSNQKKIFLIQSYHPGLVWTVQCEKGIRGVLGSKYQIFTFYMDTKRVPASEFQKKADEAWDKYQEIKPDLVMVGDDSALEFLGPKFAETETPAIFFGINNNPRNYFGDKKLPKNITGILERVPLFPWLRYLKKIMPTSRSALVLMDSSSTSDAIINLTFQERQSVKLDGISVEYKKTGNWDEWKKIVIGAERYDMIIIPTFHAVKDARGSHISVETLIEWTSSHSLVPVFSNQDYTVGPRGTVGAYVIYGEAHGRIAGKMALEILEEKKLPKSISARMDREGKFYFNMNQLDRFSLKLPDKIKEQTIFK